MVPLQIRLLAGVDVRTAMIAGALEYAQRLSEPIYSIMGCVSVVKTFGTFGGEIERGIWRIC